MAGASDTQTSINVIVWEWQNDLRLWEPYEPSVCGHIEHASRNTSAVSFSLANLLPDEFSSHHIDFSGPNRDQGVQLNRRTMKRREIRRRIVSSSEPGGVAEGVFWKWWAGRELGENPRLEWKFYPTVISQAVERVKRGYDQGVMASSFNFQQRFPDFPYTVDVAKCEQKNNSSGFVRKIKREIVVFPRAKPAAFPNSARSSLANDAGTGVRAAIPSTSVMSSGVTRISMRTESSVTAPTLAQSTLSVGSWQAELANATTRTRTTRSSEASGVSTLSRIRSAHLAAAETLSTTKPDVICSRDSSLRSTISAVSPRTAQATRSMTDSASTTVDSINQKVAVVPKASGVSTLSRIKSAAAETLSTTKPDVICSRNSSLRSTISAQATRSMTHSVPSTTIDSVKQKVAVVPKAKAAITPKDAVASKPVVVPKAAAMSKAAAFYHAAAIPEAVSVPRAVVVPKAVNSIATGISPSAAVAVVKKTSSLDRGSGISNAALRGETSHERLMTIDEYRKKQTVEAAVAFEVGYNFRYGAGGLSFVCRPCLCRL